MKRFPAVALAILIACLALFASPAKAVNPPFTEPSEWATICTDKHPALQPLVRGTNCRWLRLDGVWRRYIVYVPNNARFALDRSWPVTFMFHGTTGTGERFWRMSGWKELAERVGTIVVFPTSWRYHVIGWGDVTRWNSYELSLQIDMALRFDGYPATSPYPARDTVFVNLITADIRSALRVNTKRIFAAGFSNGANFVTRAVIDLNNLFAAGGCMSLCTDPRTNANPTYRAPLLIGLGTTDPLIRQIVNLFRNPDITEFSLDWTQSEFYVQWIFDGLFPAIDLSATSTSVTQRAKRTSVIWSTPTAGNTSGNLIQLEILKDVEHEYPTLTNNPNHFYFALLSWAFFSAHPKP